MSRLVVAPERGDPALKSTPAKHIYEPDPIILGRYELWALLGEVRPSSGVTVDLPTGDVVDVDDRPIAKGIQKIEDGGQPPEPPCANRPGILAERNPSKPMEAD